MKSNLIQEFNKKKELLKLQENFEAGNIKEEEMSKEEKYELVKLYKEQIKNIETNIKYYNIEIQGYKKNILIEKEKLKK